MMDVSMASIHEMLPYSYYKRLEKEDDIDESVHVGVLCIKLYMPVAVLQLSIFGTITSRM